MLGLFWDADHRILEAAVERGLQRRDSEPAPHVGIDQTSFGRRHDYVSVMTDIDRSRVLEVVPERTTAARDSLSKSLTPEQIESVRSVAMDMWQAFISSAAKNVPWAKIVHDRFHVARYLGEAVDKVRRSEHRELRKDGDSPLTGLRQLLLNDEEKLDEDAYFEVLTVQRADLKTGRAWAIKENFRQFWTYSTRGRGARFFDRWYAWAIRCRWIP